MPTHRPKKSHRVTTPHFPSITEVTFTFLCPTPSLVPTWPSTAERLTEQTMPRQSGKQAKRQLAAGQFVRPYHFTSFHLLNDPRLTLYYNRRPTGNRYRPLPFFAYDSWFMANVCIMLYNYFPLLLLRRCCRR